ncbi:hypothetical protein ACIQGZ_16230 [Streptomyces sp. NPDC092296]|uniref:hypothetical protein n=1 Tax=Streptomyces sp. NPDC092296 TaxID=3366012 RepID=UPI003805C647
MASSAPRDPHPGTRQTRGLLLVTTGCLVLVSAYSAAFGADAWLWVAWTALAGITAALFAVRR